LHKFIDNPSSFMVMAKDSGSQKIIGASTACALSSEDEATKAPFIAKHLPLNEYFYFSESVLLPQYRGQGWGKRFFEEREKAAVRYGGIKYLTFCAVERAKDYPHKPHDYQDASMLWRKQGFVKQPDMTTYYRWKEIDQENKTDKLMVFWVKTL